MEIILMIFSKNSLTQYHVERNGNAKIILTDLSIKLTRLIHKNNQMNNVASILLLVFLAISFVQSGYDKLFYWKDNLQWMKGHFAKRI
jgi:hypothetical protein